MASPAGGRRAQNRPHGKVLRTHRRPAARVHRQAARVLRGHRPAVRRRPRQPLPQGPLRHPRRPRRTHPRLPGLRRFARRDHRPPAGERPDHPDVVRLRGPADRAAGARPGRAGVPRRPPVRRAARPLRPRRRRRRAARDRPGAGRADQRLLRVRRPVHGLPLRPGAAPAVLRPQGRGELRRLLRGQGPRRRQHRRPALAAAPAAAAHPRLSDGVRWVARPPTMEPAPCPAPTSC
ncbi:hypothetical protein KCH_47680 [Kitasatospora cheerisanensis KCTC 2395]|uniref:Uncharacterized protein n=1 Tax=Kitasatospora cheerisanensis KCTC 2395 TaxID=1348663 RepID=A0A066YYX5_9ACTN|nr:hypothetical protein KCH_47680 [Kitasatospora cheerisanensis KCTC 2395]